MRNFAALSCLLICTACEPNINTVPATPAAPSGPTQKAAGHNGDNSAAAGLPAPASSPVALIGPKPAKIAVNASNAFAFDLFRRLRDKPGNLAYSPASISLALTMTYGGAQGTTAKQMAKVLHLPQDVTAIHGSWQTVLAGWRQTGGAYELAVANRLFGQKGFLFEKNFLAMTASNYGAPLELRDFVADAEAERKYINGWVQRKTKDRIKNLLPEDSLSKETRLVLTNAIYFKAQWQHSFPEKATADGDFFANGVKVSVPLMNRSTRAGYADVDGVQLLDLAYKGSAFSMVVVLPGAKGGLPAVETALTTEKFARWVAALKNTEVRVTLPRFKVDAPESLSLKKVLSEMGMPIPFKMELANFRGMVDVAKTSDRVFLSNLFHKAFVEVDEQGAEAAAATAAVMVRVTDAVVVEPKVFMADHPFLFIIRDVNTQAILFVGRVSNPAE